MLRIVKMEPKQQRPQSFAVVDFICLLESIKEQLMIGAENLIL